MSTSARAELSVINSVQINSSSQSIAGTLRAPKSSLLAMAVIPLSPWHSHSNAESRLRVPWFPNHLLDLANRLVGTESPGQGYDQSSDTARE